MRSTDIRNDPLKLRQQIASPAISPVFDFLSSLYHVEYHYGSRRGEPILVSCSCAIGRSHTYSEWVIRLGSWDVTPGEAPTIR